MKNLTVSPLDLAQSVDADMLILYSNCPEYGQFRTETDMLILRSLDCSTDDTGDENPAYWDTLNI